jgi:hypothetical protein
MNKLLPLFALLFAMAGLSSCTKNIGLDPLPQNKILEYKVANLPDTVIYGAIDETDHTITVYVPYYYSLSLIDPEIKVSEGAKIDGEILPVLLDTENTKYSVTGADGSKNTYTLTIVQQNTPNLVVVWGPNVAANPTTYPKMILPNIQGNFLSTNALLAKVSLINTKTNAIVQLPSDGTSVRPTENTYSYTSSTLSADIDTGYYKVRFQFLGHDVTIEKPVHVTFLQPDLLIPAREVKQGGTITFDSFNSVFVGLKAARVTVLGKTYNLPVQSFTRQQMVLQIPDDFPVGRYNYTAAYSFDFEGWNTVNKTGDLNVLAK